MLDEKLIKLFQDIQKSLDSHTLARSLQVVAQAENSMKETFRVLQENPSLKVLSGMLRAFEENSSNKRMLENIKLQEKLTRTALGPLWEMRSAGMLDVPVDSLWHQEMQQTIKAMDGLAARFTLPEATQTTRLLAEFKMSGLAESLSKHVMEASALQQAMESMRTPWLDIHESMRSIAGFAEIQGIGHALRDLPAFDETLSAALRVDLGDWRDAIIWRKEIFTDLAARSDFYLGLGFNPALTDFTLPAFEQTLDIAGLRGKLPPLVNGYGSTLPSTEADSEEKGLVRTNAAHDRLQRLERLIRKFIDKEMTRAFGNGWTKHRLPNGLYEQWQEKKRKAEEAGAEELPLVAYADFTDYEPVICKRDNWREVFAPFFGRPESVRESLQRLHPIRLDTMHARLITQDDELLLHVEVARLVKMILRGKG